MEDLIARRPAPFASRPLFNCASRDDLELELGAHYGAGVRAFGGGDTVLLARANRVQVGDVVLHYCRYDAAVEIKFQNMAGVRQISCLSGRGEIAVDRRAVEVDSATSAIISAGSSFNAAYSDGYQHIVTQFDEGALRRRAEALVDTPFPADLGLGALRAAPVAGLIKSRQITRAMAQILASGGVEIDTAVVELSYALSSAFLIENLPGLSDRLNQPVRSAGKADVRRFEAFIEANWNRPITAEDIAAACGVSVRSVFAQFRQQRGLAPLTFLRGLRLNRARQALLDPQGADSVMDVAMACGFASFGHFAQRYRERFGELPSATIAHRRPST